MMNVQKNFSLVTFLFFCFVLTSRSEDIKKIKYGKVTKEELLMKSYDKDTSAEAVILYQYAEFIPQQFKFFQQYKIKILNKNGLESGSMIFSGKLKSFIRGNTYNIQNGEIVKTKLEKESIFEERIVGDLYRTRVAMPNIKVGSVFEIEILQDGFPYKFDIQTNIPIVYGAVLWPNRPEVTFGINTIGSWGFSYRDKETWIVKDLPAFRSEPHITSENDYKVRLEFELLKIFVSTYNWSINELFASSWDAVTNKFEQNRYFGEKIKILPLYLNELSDSIKRVSKIEDDLAKNAFEAIKKIKWNEQAACYASQDLRKSFEYKSGNSADINLNLIVLLNKVGIKSFPILFSTRDNGKISKNTPSILKFNYVIAGVDLSTGIKYLDATDEFIPYGLLPERILSCLGHPLEKGRGDCNVFIEPIKKQKKTTYSQFEIDSTGNVTGKISIKRFDYNAIDFKHYLKSKTDHNDYIQELETENSNWNITSYLFTNLNDPYKDLIDEYKISYSNLGLSNILTFNPFAFIKLKENPFQKDTRLLPISFPQQTEYNSTITIRIPSNYIISELPKSASISNSDKTIRFTYAVHNNGNSISIQTSFNINKLKFETSEYLNLKGVFELMLQKQNEYIVLKKI